MLPVEGSVVGNSTGQQLFFNTVETKKVHFLVF